MIRRAFSYLFVFVLSICWIPCAFAQKEINIALITDKTSGLGKSPLVSLLEVELSQKDGIRLLERAAIDKILEEQQLIVAVEDQYVVLKDILF